MYILKGNQTDKTSQGFSSIYEFLEHFLTLRIKKYLLIHLIVFFFNKHIK